MDVLVWCAVILMLFVNGATDAPGSIAGAVSSGTLGYRFASFLCAAGNFSGTVLSCVFFPKVTEVISAFVDFTPCIIVALLLSAVTFSSVAWYFGIPTSESHGLLASLGGASLYLHGWVSENYVSVVTMGFVSCVVGIFLGYLIMKLTRRFGTKAVIHSRGAATVCAFGTSFCHGMQDGQKFAAILVPISVGKALSGNTVLICASVLAIGCFFGGKRIIDKLGNSLTENFDTSESLSSDAASFICCVVSCFYGLPVSTTYMKTCAMVGASSANGKKVNLRTLSELVFTWILTLPACMGLSWLFCAGLGRI